MVVHGGMSGCCLQHSLTIVAAQEPRSVRSLAPKPGHSSTGRIGYLTSRSSHAARRHRRYVGPRRVRFTFACMQTTHIPPRSRTSLEPPDTDLPVLVPSRGAAVSHTAIVAGHAPRPRTDRGRSVRCGIAPSPPLLVHGQGEKHDRDRDKEDAHDGKGRIGSATCRVWDRGRATENGGSTVDVKPVRLRAAERKRAERPSDQAGDEADGSQKCRTRVLHAQTVAAGLLSPRDVLAIGGMSVRG